MEDLARFVSYAHLWRLRLTWNRTWLLSFDSLGTKHPSVFIALRRYLALEAKHKKGIDVGELPKTQQAKVPVGCPTHKIECT
jgi:Ulp1 family protease